MLHRIGYEQHGAVRPIIYRLAMSEIYVPYGLPDPNWAWRTAFDIGEYNLGQFAVAQEKNADVPENAVFFDSVLAGDTGSAGGSYALPHAVAMYERDGALALAAHRSDDVRARRAVRARARREGRVLHRQLHLRGGVRLPAGRLDRRPRQRDRHDAQPGRRHDGGRQPLRQDGRAEHRRAEPSALHQLPDRLRRRRHRQPRGRGEHRVGAERVRATRSSRRRRRSRRSSSATRARPRAGAGWSRARRR